MKVTFKGEVDPEQAREGAETINSLLADMTPGFKLLTDFTGLEKMDTECAPHIRRVMDLCNEKGISLVVRVMPDPHKDIGFNILSIFHYGRTVRIVTVENLDEAMKALGM